MGRPELADDARFASNQQRVEHMTELDALIATWTAGHRLDELNAVLAEHEVPAGPILGIDAIATHPQILARAAVQTIADETGNEVFTYGPVPHLTERPIVLGRAAGRIGRDQADVLQSDVQR
jgi:formyl-CoA transferase